MKAKIYSSYVKANENIFNGDIVKITDEGKYAELKTKDGKSKEVMKFNLELKSGEVKEYTMNNTTAKNMVRAYGEETKKWIKKELKAWVVQQMSFGEMIDVLILSPKDWKKPTEGTKEEDIPVIEDGEMSPEEITEDISNIPF